MFDQNPTKQFPVHVEIWDDLDISGLRKCMWMYCESLDQWGISQCFSLSTIWVTRWCQTWVSRWNLMEQHHLPEVDARDDARAPDHPQIFGGQLWVMIQPPVRRGTTVLDDFSPPGFLQQNPRRWSWKWKNNMHRNGIYRWMFYLDVDLIQNP